MTELHLARAATPDDRADWDAFVAARPEGDMLQLWAWGEAIAGPTGQRASRLLVRRADGSVGALAQVLLRRTAFGRSVAYVPHGPLWDRDAADAGALLASILRGLGDLGRSEETRAIMVKADPRARFVVDPRSGGEGEDAPPATDADDVAAALAAAGLRRVPLGLQARVTRLLDADPDEERRLASWSSNGRNLWRRGHKEGTTVSIDVDPGKERIATFHRLLESIARRNRFGIRSPAFYEDLAARLAPGGVLLAIAEHGGTPIATMYVAIVGDRAFYLYGAASREAPKNSNGAYVAMGDVLAALAERGVRTLDVWGVSDVNDGTDDASWAGFTLFKTRFGGWPLEHPGTFDLVLDRPWWTIRNARERLALWWRTMRRPRPAADEPEGE